MRRILFSGLLVLLPCMISAAPIRLQYLPAVPVQQTSKLTLEVQESLPILNMSTKGSQMFKYDIIAQSRSPTAKKLQLPAALTMTVKDMFILVNVNGQEVTFDPRSEGGAPSLMQFSRLIDQPLHLMVNAQGNLENTAEAFDRLYKELPALKQVPLESLFNDIVSELFSLYDEDLSVGERIEMQSSPGPAFAIPAFVMYDIIEINDKEVIAALSGTLEPKKIILDKSLKGDNGRPQKVEMTLSGTVKGKATWQRSNALMHTLNSDYQYQAQFKSGNMRWTMQMNVSNIVTSAPL